MSIHQKLLALIVLLVAGVVTLLAVYLPAQQNAALRATLETKAVSYVRLASKQLEPAVAFDDRETAREVFRSIAQDPDVESLSLLNGGGLPIERYGTPSADLPSVPAAPRAFESGERIVALASVISLEGPRGTVAVELSSKRLAREQSSVRQQALLAGLLALVLGIGGASWIAGSLSRRLRRIARVADAVAAGNLDQEPLESDAAEDEISTVASAFNTMLEKIRSLIAEIRSAAQEEQQRLELLVKQRTQELYRRNGDLQRVLDNVGQGFLTLDLAGRMSEERSAVLERWFGRAPSSGSFAELLTQANPAKGAWFALGWEGLLDGVLTLEHSLDQLPRRVSARGRELELQYRPILRQDGELERVLVVVSDITERLLHERAESDERELTRLFLRASADRSGLLEFMADAGAHVESVVLHARSGELSPLKRALHTLKGNASIYGIETVAALCHSLEERLENSGSLEPEETALLAQRWQTLESKLRPLVGERGTKLEIDELEYDALLAAVERGAPRAQIAATLRRQRLEPAQLRLSRLSEQASALGQRLGKPVVVNVEAGTVRLKAEEWSAFFSAAVHVVRNAVDHGIETPEERRALGKREPARLEFRTRLDSERFVIEFGDDGRGIDWGAVEAKARRLGFASNSREKLVEALFTDGFSTRATVSDVSGRGVGLGAVRHAALALGGAIEIESTAGVGTTFRFVWPARVVTRHVEPGAESQKRGSQPPRETFGGVYSS